MNAKSNQVLNQNESNQKPRLKNKLGYIDPTVAGIDIGDKIIYVSIPTNDGVTVLNFETTTPALHKIAKALRDADVTTAVMEATGVYWIPLYDILLAQGFHPVLVDAKSVKNVPGRKTDVLDCQWIQTLYSSGILRAAFRPPLDYLPLRSYVRHRFNIVKARQKTLLQIEKSLQLMNVKLSTAVSDISGVSGMNIIRAIVAGNRDPLYLARLRSKRCKKDEQLFIDALTGNFGEENLFSLEQMLGQYDYLSIQLQQCDKKILSELEKFPDVVNTPVPVRDKDKNKKKAFENAKKPEKNQISFDVQSVLWRKSGRDFTALSGIGPSTALVIYAELGGANVSSWASVKQFASWLKLCPGNNISGGKARKSKKQPCANYITQALRMAAMSAKKSANYMGAHIRRISGKTDKLKGIKAGAHKNACLLYHMCKHGWVYFEKGEDYFEKTHREKVLKNLKKKADSLGYELTLKMAS